MNRVGFGTRLGAYVIDLIIVIVFAAIITSVFGIGGAISGSYTDYSEELGGIFGAVAGFVVGFVIVSIVYFLMEAFAGVTLGKIFLGLRIGTEDGKAGNIKLYFIRYIIKNSGAILSFLAITLGFEFLDTIGSYASLAIFVGCFFVLSAKKQAIHDLLAKTAVYRKKDLENNSLNSY